MIVCIYHCDDLDGHCSAAIVRKHVTDYGNIICHTLGANYNNFESVLSSLQKINPPWVKNEYSCYMVDYCPSELNFVRLLDATNDRLIWIDHHASSIETILNSTNPRIKNWLTKSHNGIRSDKEAACELTWQYFRQNRPMPSIVKEIGKYDTWKHVGHNQQWCEQVQYGARHLLLGDKMQISRSWDRYLEIYNLSELSNDELLQAGMILYDYNDVYKTDLANNFIIPITFEGFSTALLVFPFEYNNIFDYVSSLFTLSIKLSYIQADTWRVSLRTSPRYNINVAKIAQKYGGGGHKSAAAFTVNHKLATELFFNNGASDASAETES